VSASSEQLLRLLRLIPLASRPEGIRISEAARLSGVSEAVIDADIRVLADRSWYLPPGSTDDFQILLEGDRIRVVAPPAFRRPVRLGLHEMLAVSLALRCAGLEREEARSLCRALEEACALLPEMEGGSGRPYATDEAVAFFLRRGDADALFDRLSRALVLRRRVEVSYLKEGASALEWRRLEPWSLLHAEGESYLLAHDLDRAAPRLFRVDRMLEVRATEHPSSVPVDLDPGEVSEEGGTVRLVADGRALEEAEIRYAPAVARQVRERHPGGLTLDDGSYQLRLPILTDSWIVRQVLRFGPDAEILAPPRLRGAVVEGLGATQGGRSRPAEEESAPTCHDM
jgi:predicted DNA-binding transcriptional regulator YafY